MKKNFAILFFAITASLSANTTLINLGYGIATGWLSMDTLTLHSISGNYISLDTNRRNKIPGYVQIDPYIGLGVIDSNNSQNLLVESKSFDIGLMGIVGYGTEIVQGRAGFLIGGGFLYDVNLIMGEISALQLSAGLGAGTNFHFKPGSGDILLNVGLTLGWDPISFMVKNADFGSTLRTGQFIFNFNLGIGWMY